MVMSKIAIFPGSFDPITNAHIDIIKRALPLFDKIYVAMGVNSSRKPYLHVDTRKDILKDIFDEQGDRIGMGEYEGLRINYCEEVSGTFIRRGMRSARDFGLEQPRSQHT